MTLTTSAGPVVEAAPAAASTTATAAPRATGPDAGSVKDDGPSSLLLVGASLCILATLLLGFVAELTVIGDLRHARDQRTAYADLRFDLANSTAPVAQTDSAGRLLALGTPMALLEIPSIGVRETVLEGTTAGVLVSGPGHARSSVFPGQDGTSVLMGRRAAFGGPFANIDQLRPGQTITVSTGQGTSNFQVTGVRRAGDAQPATPVAGEGRLVLATAGGVPYVPDGVVQVDAKRTSSALQSTPVRALGAGVAGGEAVLASDSTSWVRLVFWGQALLLAALVLTIAWRRWGRWQAWVVGVPVLLFLGTAVAGQAALLLPNLM